MKKVIHKSIYTRPFPSLRLLSALVIQAVKQGRCRHPEATTGPPAQRSSLQRGPRGPSDPHPLTP